MNTQTAEKALHDPLQTDTAIEDRALLLIGRATSNQLWLMMLDEDDCLVPIVIPLDDLPPSPDRTEADLIVGRLAGTLDLAGASQAVLVWERPGRGRLTDPDLAWVRALAENCSRRGVRLRAQLLSHTGGVTAVGPGDYNAAGRGGAVVDSSGVASVTGVSGGASATATGVSGAATATADRGEALTPTPPPTPPTPGEAATPALTPTGASSTA